MASMLATLNIAKPVGKDGKVIEPVVEYHDAVFRCEGFVPLEDGIHSRFIRRRKPTAFKCSIKPRSEKAAALMRQQD